MDQEDASETLNDGLTVQTPALIKKKRNLPGNPDPDSEVIALSPKTLMTTNRFLCEVCGKGFPRDQNLQLHRRGHNLPWKLKQRNSKDAIRKRVYVCPETACVHHHPSRALGDLTGIKKHFSRKHGEKKWKCEKCCKKYAVQSDWKAHSKTCGTREYRCDCGTVFSRRDSFITHRAFCDALAQETARINAASHFNIANTNLNYNFIGGSGFMQAPQQQHFSSLFKPFPTTNQDHDEPKLSNMINPHQQTQKGISSLPLWTMNQDPSTLINHQSGSAPNSYQLNWFLADISKLGHEENPLTLMNAAPATATTTSVPSVYSNQQQEPKSAPDMSATALLQKAAQIGASSSDQIFIEGIKQNENSNLGELGGYGSNSTTTNLVGSDVESTDNVFSAMSSNSYQMDVLMFDPGNKRRRVMQQQDQNLHYQHDQGRDGGLTRDFLGVGVESLCHPCPISGWI